MVMIRNITGITPDEMESLMTLADLNTEHLLLNVPSDIARLQKLRLQRSQIGDNQGNQKTELEQQIRGILRKVETRDYLYEKIKARTGNHVILHLDHDITPHESAHGYIRTKLDTIPSDCHINLFYMGGGHGGGRDGRVDDETSGLEKNSVELLIARLQIKGMEVDTVILGSCYSAAFSNQFRGLLAPQGVMLSDSVECGGQNYFLPTIRWIQATDNTSFFSDEEINEGTLPLREVQDKFQELTSIRVNADHIQSYYNDLLLFGSSATLEQQKRIEHRHPEILEAIKNLEAQSLLKEDFEGVCAQIIDHLGKYSLDHAGASSDEAYAELEQQFPNDKKAIDLLKSMSTFFYEDNVEEVLNNLADNKEYILTATPEVLTNLGVSILKTFQNKNELYQSVQAAMRREIVTGKVISTKESSRMMEFSSSTGKPNATCFDAFKLNKLVIEKIKLNPSVSVTVEHDVRKFNNEQVMRSFNSHFSTAIEASMVQHSHKTQIGFVKAPSG